MFCSIFAFLSYINNGLETESSAKLFVQFEEYWLCLFYVIFKFITFSLTVLIKNDFPFYFTVKYYYLKQWLHYLILKILIL